MGGSKAGRFFKLVVLPGVAGILVAATLAYQQQKGEIHDRLIQRTQELSLDVDRVMLATRKSLETLAVSTSALERDDFREFDARARQVRQVMGVAAISLTDAEGRMQVNTFLPFGQPPPRGENLARIRVLFEGGRPQLSDALIGPVSGQVQMVVDVPAFRHGKVAYCLTAVIQPDQLSGILHPDQLPSGWVVAIYDRLGTIVARFPDSHAYVGRKVVPALRAGLAGPVQGTVDTTNLDGRAVLGAWVRSAETGYSVAIGAPKADIWMMLAPRLALIFVPALVVVFASFYLAHRFKLSIDASGATLAESEAKYRMLADNSGDCIFWIGTDGRYKYVSPACEAISGYRPEEFLADPGLMAAIVHDDDREAFQNHLARIHAADPEELEYRIVRRDGEVRWIAHSCHQVFDAEGWPVGRRGTNRDVTARKHAEQRLRQLSMAVEQSPESVIITNRRAEIEYVNQSFCDHTGYRRDEVQGLNPRFLQSGQTPHQNYVALWTCLTAGLAWRGEFYNKRKDGSPYVEFAIVAPIRQSNGEITHFVAVKEDITERKRMGEELDAHRNHLEELVSQRTAELTEARMLAEAANAAKSTFLANMSHEIRTPMSAILGLTHLLEQSPLTDQQRARLASIDGAARHLLDIINDILDLSKIDAGRMHIEHVNFRIEDVIERTRDLIAESARSKGLVVECESEPMPTWLKGDPIRLRQSLLNYAGNAVKFTTQGRVVLRTRLLDDREDALTVRFEVEDTGPGVAADRIESLFEAFEQGDASTTRRHGGTGLGLAITRRLARLMGGEAGATSEPGHGSTFWFTARLGRGAPEAPPTTGVVAVTAEQLRRGRKGARVLLVEDNPVNRAVAAEILEAAALDVDLAENGCEAVDRVGTGGFHLILMDMQMPEMDGLEATRAIRAQPGGRSVPIIAMTANAFVEDRQLCLAAGMNDFISKPFKPQDLYGLLMKWLPETDGAHEEDAPLPRAADGELRRRLAAIAALSGEGGAISMGLRESSLRRIVALFVESHSHEPDQLRALAGERDYEGLRRVAHGLKGAAGMLGAGTIAAVAATLVDDARRRREDIEPPVQELASALASFIGELRAALAADEGTAA